MRRVFDDAGRIRCGWLLTPAAPAGGSVSQEPADASCGGCGSQTEALGQGPAFVVDRLEPYRRRLGAGRERSQGLRRGERVGGAPVDEVGVVAETFECRGRCAGVERDAFKHTEVGVLGESFKQRRSRCALSDTATDCGVGVAYQSGLRGSVGAVRRSEANFGCGAASRSLRDRRISRGQTGLEAISLSTDHCESEANAVETVHDRDAPIHQKLAGLTPRGVYAGMAAAAATGSDDTTAALRHRACPPWAHRSVTAPSSVSTTAAWRQRRVRDVGADGRLMRRSAAAGASYHLRALAAAAAVCPAAVLEALAHDNDYRIQATATANSACPPGVVMRAIGLAARGDEVLMSDSACEEAAANPVCPASVLRRVAAAGNRHLRAGAAANVGCPPELLDVLAGDSDGYVREAAAANPNCGPDILVGLASDTSADVAVTALMNPSCPEQTLLQACGENLDGKQRHRVGVNPSCPPDLLERLVEDPDRHVAYWVMSNPSCPSELVERYVTDPSPVVRSGVAQRRGCPADLLARLAADEAGGVRRDVVENPAAPHRVVVALSEDRIGSVRQAVADRLSEMIT